MAGPHLVDRRRDGGAPGGEGGGRAGDGGGGGGGGDGKAGRGEEKRAEQELKHVSSNLVDISLKVSLRCECLPGKVVRATVGRAGPR